MINDQPILRRTTGPSGRYAMTADHTLWWLGNGTDPGFEPLDAIADCADPDDIDTYVDEFEEELRVLCAF